jgi:hypothetical protein
MLNCEMKNDLVIILALNESILQELYRIEHLINIISNL